nr:2049_t:CDS:2 [Entrophospora candida]
MPEYSTDKITFITLQLLSISLLMILIVSALRSKPYFTKWTLFQIYALALFNGAIKLPAVLIYGNDITNILNYSIVLCVLQQKLALFSLISLQFFSFTLLFYLWYALTKGNIEIEKKCSLYFSVIIWSYSVFYNVFTIARTSSEENWGSVPTSLTCASTSDDLQFYGYLIPTTILLIFSTVVTFGSIMKLLEKKVTKYDEGDTLLHSSSTLFNSTLGIIIFLLFGTTKRATLFLPCYYVAPDALKSGSSFRSNTTESFPINNIDNNNNNSVDNNNDITVVILPGDTTGDKLFLTITTKSTKELELGDINNDNNNNNNRNRKKLLLDDDEKYNIIEFI